MKQNVFVFFLQKFSDDEKWRFVFIVVSLLVFCFLISVGWQAAGRGRGPQTACCELPAPQICEAAASDFQGQPFLWDETSQLAPCKLCLSTHRSS